jgi:hypothetical protein
MVGKIVVAGDVTIDWLQFGKNYENSHNWEFYPGIKMVPFEGGALLLAKMVKNATNINLTTYELQSISDISPDEVIHSVALLDKYKHQKKTVYRVKKYCGFSGPDDGSPEPKKIKNDIKNPDMVIIDDAGNGFRDFEDTWPESLQNEQEKPLILMKMSRPLQEGKLWKKLLKTHKEELLVIISVNDLREQGVNISRKLSWEQTAIDFSRQIADNPGINQLKNLKNLIIRIGNEGAIHYQNNTGEPKSTLYYDPLVDEGGYHDKYKGNMQGFGSVFVAAVAAKIAEKCDTTEIGDGIKNGIKSCKLLFEQGFGFEDSKPQYPGSEIFNNYPEGGVASIEISGDEKWTILGSKARWKIESMAKDIVVYGPTHMFNSVPVASFGGLFTVDRTEIESYHSIRNLMKEYINNETPKRPLSIAVFGPPGSGKSFGVTQLAMSIDKDKVEKLEFNVSQFSAPQDMIVALHKVRDKVLKGKIPLVFFDEFDSEFKRKLGWLKYFLAPMQDGEFKEGDSVHPIGKCIFVFAGGTSDTFQLFSREDFKPEMTENEIKESKELFRAAKGTDFVSRIRGYINILGPNPQGDDDELYTVRRALLLRSILERNVGNIFENKKALIDPGVLDAFLQVSEYRHGVRSMESIIDASMLSDRKKFEQSTLPSGKQLEINVNAEEFLKLVNKKTLFGGEIEKIAIQIHNYYLQEQSEGPKTQSPAFESWDDLSEEYKESNRGQAFDIQRKLKETNYGWKPVVKTSKGLNEDIITPEDMELMAEMEHDRWMKEKKENGWKYGEVRDNDKKITPYLLPYEDLDEDAKDLDRNAVNAIPEIMENAGFEIYSLK